MYGAKPEKINLLSSKREIQVTEDRNYRESAVCLERICDFEAFYSCSVMFLFLNSPLDLENNDLQCIGSVLLCVFISWAALRISYLGYFRVRVIEGVLFAILFIENRWCRVQFVIDTKDVTEVLKCALSSIQNTWLFLSIILTDFLAPIMHFRWCVVIDILLHHLMISVRQIYIYFLN